MRKNRFQVFTPKKVQLETDSFWDAIRHVEKLRKSGKYPVIKMAYLSVNGTYQEYAPHEYRSGKLEQ